MHSSKINPDHIMKDVYSYPFPEVREHIRTTDVDPDFMLNTIPAAEAAGLLESYDFKPPLILPERPDGSLDLDELHAPVIERIRANLAPALPGLETFEHAYPTHGSSQAMFTLMAEWHARGEMESLAVLEGEYEGYQAYAEALRIPITKYASLNDAKKTPGQVWFVSNPSALAGNWHDDSEWHEFLAAGHETVIDAAYVGLTEPKPLDMSAQNIKAVLTSPSKIFGVFRYRNTGITYTREPVASMYGTKWFKDVPALLDTLSLYEKFPNGTLAEKYRPAQAFLCRQLTELTEVEVVPSDVLLLAHTAAEPGEEYRQFRRGMVVRFGLTKLFEDLEA